MRNNKFKGFAMKQFVKELFADLEVSLGDNLHQDGSIEKIIALAS
jgi:hypothetical protein